MDSLENINVFGEPVITCSNDPLTGFFRDGCCSTDVADHGMHTVCAVMTEEFLSFSKSQGNDLSTPRPEFNFNGLKPGDKWCLCAARWKEAYDEGKAPKVLLEATHERTLAIVSIDQLIEHSVRN
ncbi:MAG TPA: DUF2237 domain-containing protein [Flavobacteriales bacterium]|nr:DUF2237 domain-containing protein [Flavobacteriales bacterium]